MPKHQKNSKKAKKSSAAEYLPSSDAMETEESEKDFEPPITKKIKTRFMDLEEESESFTDEGTSEDQTSVTESEGESEEYESESSEGDSEDNIFAEFENQTDSSEEPTINEDEMENEVEEGWTKIESDSDWSTANFFANIRNNGIQSPKTTLKSKDSPKDFFNLFLPPQVFEAIANYTNINARTAPVKTKKTKKKSKQIKWEDCSKENVECFFGMLIYMGVIQLPEIELHWSANDLLRVKGIEKLMSRDEFRLMNRYILFYDKTYPINIQDNLYKIRIVIDYVMKASINLYEPSKNLSIDESMVKFDGSQFKIYMPSKPIRYGFKMYMLCENETAYVLKVAPCMDNSTEKNEENTKIAGLTLKLLEGFDNRGFHIYMDSYYSSVNLFENLQNLGIAATGTIGTNRKGLPKKSLSKAKKNLELHDANFWKLCKEKNELILCQWMDKNPVLVISNYANNNWEKTKRWMKSLSRKTRSITRSQKPMIDEKDDLIPMFKQKEIDIPVVVHNYTKFMRAVDLFNQHTSYYINDQRSRKWYRSLLYFYVEIALRNSYIIYTKVCENEKAKPMSVFKYRLKLIEDLLESFIKKKKVVEVKPKKPKLIQQALCRLKLMEKQGDCEMCSKKNGQPRKLPKYMCVTHNVHLCPDSCYDDHRRIYELGNDDLIPGTGSI